MNLGDSKKQRPSKRYIMKSKNLLYLLGLFLLPSCKDDDTSPDDTPLAAQALTNVSYGSDPEQKMDVYLPEGRDKNTPVVILLHGGGFILGDKGEFTMQSQLLSQKGYAVLNVNYRLVDTTGLFSLPPVHQASDITIHDQLDDIEKALDFARSKSDEWVVSDEKIGITGHSAGGTLALLFAYGDHNDDGHVKVVGNWAGATTLAFNDQSEFDSVDPRFKEVYFRMVGAEVTNQNLLAFMAVSPYWVLNNAEEVPPTINIRPENNILGDLPDNSATEYQTFTKLLNDKGVANEYVEVAGADHGFGQTGNWETVIAETDAFFEVKM